MNLNENRAWKVPSASHPGEWQKVRRYADADKFEPTWTCSCTGFRFGQRRKADFRCRHIRIVRQRILAEFSAALDGKPVDALNPPTHISKTGARQAPAC